MTDTTKESKRKFSITTLIVTYVIVKTIRLLTGFNYDFSEGLLNLKFFIDIALWIIVYYAVDFLIRKVFFKSYFN